MKTYDHTWLIGEWERMNRPAVERYSNNREKWEADENPKFIVYFQYRIKCKPWINWDHVSKKYKYMTYGGGNIGVRLYQCKPHYNGYGWSSTEGDGISADDFSSFVFGDGCSVENYLVKRPSISKK